jgi:hypothetical protein
MVKYCRRVAFPVMLDMAPYPFLTEIVTFISWLPVFLTRQSRGRLRSLHDIPQNIRLTDLIE